MVSPRITMSTPQREYVCMCEEHEFVASPDLDEELTVMLANQTAAWTEKKQQLEDDKVVESNSPPPSCQGKFSPSPSHPVRSHDIGFHSRFP